MATNSSILAWEIPWTEEPGGLHPWGGKRVRHDFMTEQQQHTLIITYNLYYLPKTQTSNMITLIISFNPVEKGDSRCKMGFFVLNT